MKERIFAYLLAGFLSFAPVVFAHGPGEGYPTGPWMNWWGHGMGWWIFPFAMMVVMAIFFFVFFLSMGRRRWRSPWCGFNEQEDEETALDILKKRYAKGEISREEFEAIKKDL